MMSHSSSADRVQDVDAGEAAVVYKASLEQRFPRLGGLQRLLEHLLEVGHARADLDAAGVKRLGQSADLVALIEDRLLAASGSGIWSLAL